MKSVAIPPSHTSGVCAPSPVEIDDKEHILNRAGSKMETYKGARTLTELKEFVTTTKGEAGKAASQDGKVPEPVAASPVAKLDKDNFDTEVKTGVAFVKLFAPWWERY